MAAGSCKETRLVGHYLANAEMIGHYLAKVMLLGHSPANAHPSLTAFAKFIAEFSHLSA
jgi:hypothetical protein